MGGGGYVAGPVGLAALTLRIPVVLTEADSQLGLTNRMLAPFARRVCLAFPLAGRNGSRYRVTGRPVPVDPRRRPRARARLGIAPEETCVLVFGGSLGARSINLAGARGLHGRRLSRAARVRKPRLPASWPGGSSAPGYDLREYLDMADFADALAAADLVVARAGGSVFEIAAHGAAGDPRALSACRRRPPERERPLDVRGGRGDHDRRRRAHRRAAGAETLALLADRPRLDAMASASRSLARPEAALEVAAELLDAAA